MGTFFRTVELFYILIVMVAVYGCMYLSNLAEVYTEKVNFTVCKNFFNNVKTYPSKKEPHKEIAEPTVLY